MSNNQSVRQTDQTMYHQLEKRKRELERQIKAMGLGKNAYVAYRWPDGSIRRTPPPSPG